MAESSAKKQINMQLFIVTIMLVTIGVLMVFDASYPRALKEMGNSSYFGNKQLSFAILGIILMLIIMSYLKYWKLIPFVYVFLFATILLLVLVPFIGLEEYGSKRWIGKGIFRFQPSEFAKLSVIIYLAYILSKMREDVTNLKSLLWVSLPVMLICLLIVVEDMGTAIVIVATILIMYFLAGVKMKHIFGFIVSGLVFGAMFVLMETYRMKRLLIFLDPFSDPEGLGYQICQSLIALGSGGFWGMGICEGRQKLMFLPAEHTDFIFAVLGQETGFLGATLLIILFILFGVLGIKIASGTKDPFGKLLAGGITCMICCQALLNIAVVTSSLPATGVPLPFISYGGTSLVMNLISVGILLAVSKYPGALNEYKSRANRRGTGGHAYPAICVAHELKSTHPDCELLYIGGTGSIEEKLAGASNIPFEGLKTRKIKKLLSIDSIGVAYTLISGIMKAGSILYKFKPDIVVGTGGYASAAVCLAQFISGRKTLIHEQNAVPGRTNLLISRFASKVCVTFENSVKYFPDKKTVLTGLPVRSELLDLPDKKTAYSTLGLSDNMLTLLVYGGSQGSVKLNNVIMESLPELQKLPVQIIHQTGERNYKEVQYFQSYKGYDNYYVFPYFDDIRPVFASADLMLTRAGASTISEITAIGIPSIYVPYPYAYANHQFHNAKFIVDNGGGILIEENNFTSRKLIKTISGLLAHPDDLNVMRENSKRLGKPDAAKEIVALIDEMLT